ncbi:MAG: Flp pilus assembly protein CpaB [Bradyrhizobiaceae bacterium]|nr:Flp pilus assembly protein CpaB [Bradyrhizobiaceae bacterium]
MRTARIVVLGIALAAGGLAFMLSGRTPAPVKVVQPASETVDILVAKSDIDVGRSIGSDNLAWQPWPVKAAGPLFVKRSARPNAIDELKGSVARGSFIAGEPIREQKLVKASGSGFMSAILPAGMRAVSTEISPESGAGGFILPNDYVDVILTHQSDDRYTSETVLRNIRVLAIDQTIQEKDGQKVVVGRTATLELSPSQAETLVLSRRRGGLSLALRSLADARPAGAVVEEEVERKGGNINVVRFGVTSVQSVR